MDYTWTALLKCVASFTKFEEFIDSIKKSVMVLYPWPDMNPQTIVNTDFNRKIINCSWNTGHKAFHFQHFSPPKDDGTISRLHNGIKDIVVNAFVTSLTPCEIPNFMKYDKKITLTSWFIFQRTLVFAPIHFRQLSGLTPKVRTSFSDDERYSVAAVAQLLSAQLCEILSLKLAEKCISLPSDRKDEIVIETRLLFKSSIIEYLCFALIATTTEVNVFQHLQRAAELLLIDVVDKLEDWYGGDGDQLESIPRALAILFIIATEIKFSFAVWESR